MSVIALLTDFGRSDAYAGVLHGVIAGIAPARRVVDLCHEVAPQDVRAGAFVLLTAYRYFPPGTVFVAVVDPGVGTERAVVAVRAGGSAGAVGSGGEPAPERGPAEGAGPYLFVGPDNGLLRWAVDDAGGAQEAVRVEREAFRLPVVSRTFHGRDVIAPAAAHLALGVPLGALGPPLGGPLAGSPFPRPSPEGDALAGEVVAVDRFGNCITNLPPLAGEVRFAGRPVPRGQTYAAGRSGEPLVLAGSAGFLELAVPGGSAAATLGAGVGARVILLPTDASGPPAPAGPSESSEAAESPGRESA